MKVERTRRTWKSGIFDLGAMALSAALMAAAQDAERLWWVSFFGLLPILSRLGSSGFLRTWALLAGFEMLYTAGSMSWLTLTGSDYGWAVPAAAVYNGLSMFLPAGSFALSRRRKRGSQTLALLMLPAGWATMELLQRLVGLRYVWPPLGSPLVAWPLLAQVSALAGPEILSYLVIGFNTACLLCFRAKSFRHGVRRGSLIVGLLGLTFVYGTWRIHSTQEARPNLRIALVQPNVSTLRKWNPQNRAEDLKAMDGLIDALRSDRPDLVVLPETAVPGFVRYENDLTVWVKGAVTRTGVPLIFGAIDRDQDRQHIYNVAILITPYNSVGIYQKIRLAPFAESVPGASWWAQASGASRKGPLDFTAGEESTIFELPSGARLGTLICLEEIIPDLLRRIAAQKADAALVLINSERFNGSSEPLQQLRRAQLSAICAGLPLVRCANSGISGVIDDLGRVTDTMRDAHGAQVGFAGSKTFILPLQHARTLYQIIGDGLSLIWLGGLAGIAWLLRPPPAVQAVAMPRKQGANPAAPTVAGP